MTVAMPAAGAIAAVVLVLRRLFVAVTVTGYSMYPALRPEDVLLVAVNARPRPGRIVVVRVHGPAASGGWFVKRVAAVPGDPVPRWAPVGEPVVPPGMLLVRGDNPRSMDSKQWGYCPADAVLGRAVCRLRRGPR